MFLLNYILAFMVLFMVAPPVYAKGKYCHGCKHEGELKCDAAVLGKQGTRVCRNGCWAVNDLVCQANEICRERPTIHCITQFDACAGCAEFLDHCREDYWDICGRDCQVACARKTCEYDAGRCDFDCQMDICQW